MKIGYDAKRAFLNQTGLGNYSRWLIETTARYFAGNTYFLYTPKIRATNRLGFLKDRPNIITKTPSSKFFTSLWRSKGIVKDLKRDGVELYHGLSHELPVGIERSGIRSVVTVHDLIFMRFPEQFGRVSRSIYDAKVRRACAVADKIIAISQKTKDDLVELLGISPGRIEVVYQNCDPVFAIPQSDEQKQAVKSKYHLPDGFILSVGTIEERKNLLLLVKALAKTPDAKLVVVGKPTDYLKTVQQFIDANGLANRVIFLHQVSFAELPALYQLAKLFVYPSRYEGFGIPILEALYSGVPVIAATGSCLEEAGGPDSLYVGPDNSDDLAAKINLVLSDSGLREKMITGGLQYTANFADEKLAAQLMQLYKNVNNA